MNDSCCHPNPSKRRLDLLLFTTLSIVTIGYAAHFLLPNTIAHIAPLATFCHAIVELVHTMWWGVVIGIFFVGIISYIPRELVVSVLGHKNGIGSILRATIAGVLLDLCSHGILLVAMKLYERGAKLGQVMAFLIASPWNSLTLTVILVAMIGLPLTILYVVLSMVIALISGIIFQRLVDNHTLPAHPNPVTIDDDFTFKQSAKKWFATLHYSHSGVTRVLATGITESTTVLRWLLLGVVIAALIRSFVSADNFATYFGATFAGLMLTILASTIIEVCSEGSVPIAADLVNRAGSPGNGFAFLMTGVSTDYTEIMTIKDRMASWKIALFLPLITVPQIIVIAWLMTVSLR